MSIIKYFIYKFFISSFVYKTGTIYGVDKIMIKLILKQAFPTQFNRGLLANVGFLTASSADTYTCYIIHDVDLLVQDDRNMYRCGRVPRHLTASNSKFENK
jgi:hypothetical protein